MASQKRIAIVGAGLRGLASAAYLHSVGAQVRVFEKASEIGGVWRLVHDGAQVNTPSYGYAFHATNQWNSFRPTRAEILANLERMVDAAGLEDSIALGTPIERVAKTARGTWTLNGGDEEFDGLLVCPGFLGRRQSPPDDLVADFDGDVFLPYDFAPETLRDKRVTVVGSGSTALDMLSLAHGAGCSSASLFIRPEIEIRDVGTRETLIHAIASNPLLYLLTKKPGGQPAAVRPGIHAVLNARNVGVERVSIDRVTNTAVHTAEGRAIPTDVIVWCTGWESPTPSWVADFDGDPTLVLAACKRCLDTAGFGFGASTVHAKALLATLQYGLTERFESGSPSCNCDQDHFGFSRHILLNLALFYLGQPARWKLLRNGLREGVRSNIERFRCLDEPLWIRLLAFLNAPFGF